MTRTAHLLYDNQEKVIFDDGPHTYTNKDGIIIPNATGVVGITDKRALRKWYKDKTHEAWCKEIEPGRIYDEIELEAIKERAYGATGTYSGHRQDIGSHIHKWCENYVNYLLGVNKLEPPMPINKQIKTGVQSFLNFLNDHGSKIEWLFAERITFHRDNFHVGTADIGGIHKQYGPTIFDVKTGKYVYAEAGLQTASYAKSVQLEFPKIWHNPARGIIHLSTFKKKYSFWDEPRITKTLTGYSVDEDYECFLHLLGVYNWIVGGPNKWNYLGKK